MCNENLYLIHKDDYIRHINEKLTLFDLLHRLVDIVQHLPDCQPNNNAKLMATACEFLCSDLRTRWGLPARETDTLDDNILREMLEGELIAPEDAGYLPIEELAELLEAL